MNQAQEGAENLLDYAKPTEPVNLTFWQTCKAHPWPACVAFAVVLGLLSVVFWPKDKPEPHKPAVVSAPTPSAESALQPAITPKKIARQATKMPSRGADLPADKAVSDDVLGDLIAEIERKRERKKLQPIEPAPSASLLEQDFESRLFNFERKIP
jgi:hypothetical protein